MAYKFKVGNKVRVVAGEKRLENIGISDFDLTGEAGEIIAIEKDGDELPYDVKFKKTTWWFAAKDLELVEDIGYIKKDYVDNQIDDGLASEVKPTFARINTKESKVRTFSTGATRDTDTNKLDYEGFISPLVLKRYAQYMHKHRKQSDGKLRDSDNWQKGIPQLQYRKSLVRHLIDAWIILRGWQELSDVEEDIEDLLCAIKFNTDGLLHEILKEKIK
jgi:hypothetical protein